jgi:hypothetical protein
MSGQAMSKAALNSLSSSANALKKLDNHHIMSRSEINGTERRGISEVRDQFLCKAEPLKQTDGWFSMNLHIRAGRSIGHLQQFK